MLTQPASMLSKSLKSFVLCAFALSLYVPLAQADVLKIQRQGEYTFITGGIDDDERAFLEVQAPKYPIQLVIRNNGLLSESKEILIRVKNVSGELMVEAKALGPFFYINPPASGRFTLEAQLGAQSIVMTKDLVGRRYLNLVFDFTTP
ncbi:hypothetical protein MCEMSE6_01711 [Oxalobacteraceae bacterium]|jgi:hypothetical protein